VERPRHGTFMIHEVSSRSGVLPIGAVGSGPAGYGRVAGPETRTKVAVPWPGRLSSHVACPVFPSGVTLTT
jgi:hypothetical protein